MQFIAPHAKALTRYIIDSPNDSTGTSTRQNMTCLVPLVQLCRSFGIGENNKKITRSQTSWFEFQTWKDTRRTSIVVGLDLRFEFFITHPKLYASLARAQRTTTDASVGCRRDVLPHKEHKAIPGIGIACAAVQTIMSCALIL